MSRTIAPEFHVILADPCPDSTWEEPEDLSGILTEFENRWRRFCYESNHEVNLAIAAEEKKLFLNPDFLDIKQIISVWLSVKLGFTWEIYFHDRFDCCFNLDFGIASSVRTIHIELVELRYPRERKTFTLDRSQVGEALSEFMNRAIALAISKHYITQAETVEFIHSLSLEYLDRKKRYIQRVMDSITEYLPTRDEFSFSFWKMPF